MRPNKLRRAAMMTASGFRRYPREMIASFRLAEPEVDPMITPEALAAFERQELAAVWLGHASVLMRIGGPRGLTVLTDPVFSHRIGMRVGKRTFGMPRLCPLPVSVDQLPPIDLILLSHAHFDHLDRPTLQRLASRHTAVVTARRTARLVPPGFARTVELDWERGLTVSRNELGRKTESIHIRAIRPRHWGARFGCDRRRGFNSYVVEGRTSSTPRVLFAGDTAMTDAFDRVGAVDLAVFGIGAYEPWEHAHANPEEVWRMFTAIDRAAPGRSRLLPIHHSTFELGAEHVDEPMERLLAVAGPHGGERIVGRSMGEVWAVPDCASADRPAAVTAA